MNKGKRDILGMQNNIYSMLLYGKIRYCVKGSASTVAKASGIPKGVEVDKPGARLWRPLPAK